MQKRLVKVGNSLALVIDKRWLSVLNINRTSRLNVRFDGGRLLVEPLDGDGDPRTPGARDALKTFNELQRLGLTQELFDQLAPLPMQLGAYVRALDRSSPAQEIAVTTRRMRELRQRLRAGWSKREAIAAAVAAAPFELPTGVETRLDEPRSGTDERALLDVLIDAEYEEPVRVDPSIYDE